MKRPVDGAQIRGLVQALDGWWWEQGPLRSAAGLLRHVRALDDPGAAVDVLIGWLEQIDADLRRQFGEYWWRKVLRHEVRDA